MHVLAPWSALLQDWGALGWCEQQFRQMATRKQGTSTHPSRRGFDGALQYTMRSLVVLLIVSEY